MEKTFTLEEIGSRLEDALNAAVVAANMSQVYFRHGAVLFKKSHHYKAGFNQYRTVSWAWKHPPKDKPDAIDDIRLNNMHAEVSCMHNVRRDDIRGADVFVVRLNPKGELRNSRPCESCQRNMKLKGIRRCYYSIDDTKIGCLSLKDD